MSGDLRRGWCPGALRPMAAADGLIIRLRPSGGILTTQAAQRVADLAEVYGNAKLDLSARANLQIRGVRTDTLRQLLDALRGLGLIDLSPEAEAIRNVIASPGAGLHGGLDIRPLVAALEARLTETRDLHALPGKFGWLVDDGSRPSLAAVPADVRFVWRGMDFAILVGGSQATASPVGVCRAADLADTAEAIGRRVLALFRRHPDARRIRTLIEQMGVDCVRAACRPGRIHEPEPPYALETATHGLSAAELHAPYGRLSAEMLRVAATLVSSGNGEVRLTPWRSVMLPGVSHAAASVPAARTGWIVARDDPRLAVAACVGSPDCARATTLTRSDADALATSVVGLGPGIGLHVSGCVKGCAHSTAAAITLVGRDGQYDLVRRGRAGDPPSLRGLTLAQARRAIAAARPA